MGTYSPDGYVPLTYHDLLGDFEAGKDTPRAYLERCIETIAEREPVVRAFNNLNLEGARAAADESTRRWQSGQALSRIDGMPLGIKDLLETVDMPTTMNCDAMAGNFPKRDNAAVWALRQAGAIPIGKTVTAELGGSHPGPTTNPFDQTRTPGGSSSGSAAAVAARMVPGAIGSQVGGSIIRPAGFCGNYALKPTQGGINRGERNATSMSTHGPHAGSIEDMWQIAIEIARRAGGDRGSRALNGPAVAPSPAKPVRLMVLETAGMAVTDDATRSAFDTFLADLAGKGVELLTRSTSPEVEALEQTIVPAGQICIDITGWENRWYQRNMLNEKGGGLSRRAIATLERAEAMSVEDYEHALLRRDQAQLAYGSLRGLADAAITLSCPGPAPAWIADGPDEPLTSRPTGNAIFNYPSSMLFAPVVTIPKLAVDGLPVGIQIMGQPGEDARMTSIARWIAESCNSVAV